MMPETGRLTTKKMVYLFVYISTLTYNISHSEIHTHIQTGCLVSLIFRCMHTILNRYKTFLSQQRTTNTAKYVWLCPDPTKNQPKPQKSWIVLWSILHIVLLIIPWFMSTKLKCSSSSYSTEYLQFSYAYQEKLTV